MKKTLINTTCGLAFVFSVQAYASGLYLYEVGTEDVGLAGAGQAARAQDAGTIVSNPAGLTRLQGDHLTLGGQALYGDAHYNLDGNGKGPGNVIGWFPGASSFLSHSINDDVKIGLGMYGNYGLGLHFGRQPINQRFDFNCIDLSAGHCMENR